MAPCGRSPGRQQQRLELSLSPRHSGGNAAPPQPQDSHQLLAEERQAWVSTRIPLGHLVPPWLSLRDTLTLWQLDASFAKMLMRQGSATRATQGEPGPAGTLLQRVPARRSLGHPHAFTGSLRCGPAGR